MHGFKAQIDETDWLIVKVNHSVGDGGYTTKLELEMAGTENRYPRPSPGGPGHARPAAASAR